MFINILRRKRLKKERSYTHMAERITTPMSSAGILGISSGEEQGGWKVDPRAIIVFIAAFIIGIKILGYLSR